ncbi:hypothetical protein J31TS4_26810 [Paenibacillus sp. J31TS4]|uniref:hypothetical protein n=1 Tax=Paenibacillus sp. J31TS4 TaxID=2807195 RepID=UPI001B1AF7F2|nr:hypothetical protein [Paenibacillus sp. J31TS4]GIP39401.1 hypothetical protein J31TS4_26810 [Paenibacillus sp. J31TS4]
MRQLVDRVWSSRSLTTRYILLYGLGMLLIVFGIVLARLERTSSAVAYGIVVTAALYTARRLVMQSGMSRLMTITSPLLPDILERIRTETGKEALRAVEAAGETRWDTAELYLYRLEERTLRDLIEDIDPDAVIDVRPVYEMK